VSNIEMIARTVGEEVPALAGIARHEAQPGIAGTVPQTAALQSQTATWRGLCGSWEHHADSR
jgi:hypothetical protein